MPNLRRRLWQPHRLRGDDERVLAFTVKAGNDLVTPQPQWDFPGLVAGDHWCLCAARWLEAAKAGQAPLVVLEATHEKALEIVPLDLLKKHAADPA